jgi:oligosaccharyltransferase complex subunit delta (ribophorin II)
LYVSNYFQPFESRILTTFSQWAQVSPRLTHAFSPAVLPFILSLGAYEILIFCYWVNLNLGQVLLYGGILAVITLFTGKHALRSIAKRRLKN